jgi:hypothetical protein
MTTAVAGTFTEECVEVADLRVQLRMGGKGEPLLVLHSEVGVPGWLQAYEALAEYLTVYVPSLPGFDQSARPDWIVSVRDLAAWVTWFARDLGLPQPMPVGGRMPSSRSPPVSSISKRFGALRLRSSSSVGICRRWKNQ